MQRVLQGRPICDAWSVKNPSPGRQSGATDIPESHLVRGQFPRVNAHRSRLSVVV
jgi:hypothetical protein